MIRLNKMKEIQKQVLFLAIIEIAKKEKMNVCNIFKMATNIKEVL